ncbi:DNA-directed RNA polymerase subunit RPC12/RpoP [Crossiella equi]|uniref:DNA-directed RNA polymerase subunit RPC12/RpoP n=1 Tax=Crossiella equi TaxID=130796 RepID=A0ABS5A3M1_9PSEU|nr:hypothetical protein [Crossiella equi]MBP2471131.1 DNA-directed RNA polymerase subunit RPC12/RpoP [Crossiella equi]
MSTILRRLGLAETRHLCAAHPALDAQTLAALAPIATDGHRAHLVLHIGEHADQWRAGSGTPPAFVTRGKLAAELDWDAAQQAFNDPVQRRELVHRRMVGDVVTAHLVDRAEPLIRRVLRPMASRTVDRTPIAEFADLLCIARAAVAQGIWAYDPDRCSGPHYLRQWIEEHVHREMSLLLYQVAIPAKVYRRFRRIAAVRATLVDQLDREPTYTEMLAQANGAFTLTDLNDERYTRPRRSLNRTGLDTERIERDGADIHLATSDRTDRRADEAAIDAAEQPAADPALPVGAWGSILNILQLGPQQADLVAQHAGIPPYDELTEAQRTEHAIAARIGTPRSEVHEILLEFRLQAAGPDGRLRHVLGHLRAEEIDDLELTNLVRLLAPIPAAAEPPAPMPVLLTGFRPRLPEVPQRDVSAFTTQYRCTHCGWTGQERWWRRRFTLAELRCPACSRRAELHEGNQADR